MSMVALYFHINDYFDWNGKRIECKSSNSMKNIYGIPIT